MPINNTQTQQIKTLLRTKLTEKLAKYERETRSMPFLVKLTQDTEKVATYSFIHSLTATLGMSIYEQVAKIISSSRFDVSETQYDVKGKISNKENAVIANILQELKNKTRKANKLKEIKEILKCKSENGKKMKLRADLFLKKGKREYYFEIKTSKPNSGEFSKAKQKLLEWVALRKKNVTTILAIPYNPYHPKPYSRFSILGVLDKKKELYVAERFWNMLGGKGTYKKLLRIFDDIGKEFKSKINSKIKKLQNQKMDIKK